MSTASNTGSSPAITVAYARDGSRGRGRKLWAAGAVVVVLAAVGWFTLRGGPVASLTGARLNRDGSTYVVRPMELNITLTEDGELKPKRSIELKSEVEGQTTIVYIVEESTQVKKGDLLVELASDAIVDRVNQEQLEVDRIEGELRSAESELEIQRAQNNSNLLKAQTDLEIAEKDLDKYLNGDFKKQLSAIEIDIDETNLRKKRKEEELADNQYLAEKGFISEAMLEPIQMELKILEMELEQHKLAKKMLLEYEKPMIVKQKQTTILQAQEALERAQLEAKQREEKAIARVEQYRKQLENHRETLARKQEQLKKCKIYAPADGIVRYPDNNSWRGEESQLVVGSKVFESQTLVVLPDTSQLIVSTRVHEADRHKIEVGDPCLIKVPAAPGETLTGKVAKIATFADTTNRWLNPELKEHTTEILLDETDAPVSPGDSAEVEILIDHLTDVLAVPVQCVYSRGPKNFVFRRDGRTAEPVEVELGASNESFVEIASGLKPGDEVLMSADDRLLAKLPAVDISAAEIAGRSADAKRRGPAHNSAAGRRPAKPPTGRTSRASGGGKPATP